ncbi:hydroxypyruvate isomerase [Chitinophaga parva]|uniref:Hydroxypyruvate isomerase n=2 Tax=Chitinophaga parva TaxID=2169414 RepID=A0A2T7BL86_9BACT|nr:hydroxypyruvate isomerase [Chitinophaga parva]
MPENHSRRQMLKQAATVALAVTSLPSLAASVSCTETTDMLKGNIHHSACAWCYSSIPLDDMCKAFKAMGLEAIDLLDPPQFATAHKYGLDCGIVASINKDWDIYRGWNRPEHHDPLVEYYQHMIDETANAGFKNLICFSGARKGLNDEQGMDNCATGLKRIMSYAEKKKVTIVMELLNSKIDHHDYQCDHTAWGVELAKKIGSERFKLLYDIYHMQIMEGDVIRTITDNHQYIAHYHTGGVPGRHEIDDTQETFYPAVMRAIVATGYKGYVAQEFIPTEKDKLAALKRCVKICDV